MVAGPGQGQGAGGLQTAALRCRMGGWAALHRVPVVRKQLERRKLERRKALSRATALAEAAQVVEDAARERTHLQQAA